MVLERELSKISEIDLFQLKQASIIDRAWAIAQSIHTQYQSKLWHIQYFEQQWNISQTILKPTVCLYPAYISLIPLMWYQDVYSLWQ